MHVFLTIKTLRWDKGEEMLMRFPNAYWQRKAHSRLIRNGVCVWRKWGFVALVMVSYVRSVRFVYVMRLPRLCDAPLPLYI